MQFAKIRSKKNLAGCINEIFNPDEAVIRALVIVFHFPCARK